MKIAVRGSVGFIGLWIADWFGSRSHECSGSWICSVRKLADILKEPHIFKWLYKQYLSYKLSYILTERECVCVCPFHSMNMCAVHSTNAKIIETVQLFVNFNKLNE